MDFGLHASFLAGRMWHSRRVTRTLWAHIQYGSIRRISMLSPGKADAMRRARDAETAATIPSSAKVRRIVDAVSMAQN